MKSLNLPSCNRGITEDYSFILAFLASRRSPDTIDIQDGFNQRYQVEAAPEEPDQGIQGFLGEWHTDGHRDRLRKAQIQLPSGTIVRVL